jgi:D-amino-acid dehydrogenase
MPDGLPCLGAASATPDIVHAFGHGHVGLVAAPRTARLVRQILTGHPPEIDIQPYAARRFG